MSGGDSFSRRRGPVSGWAAMARQTCSECASGVIWGTARDLVWHVGPGERLNVFRLIDFCGPDADAWRCMACGNWGVFDSSQGFGL